MNNVMLSVQAFSQPMLAVSGEKLLNFFSSPEIIAVYWALILFLVSVLVSAILIALHLIRKSTDSIPEDIRALLADAQNIQKGNIKKVNTGNGRFPQLARIDEELAERTPPAYDSATLEEICQSFQAYAAGKMGLYYEIADIRRFVAGMGISKLVILRGISGTGKTSLAYAAGEFFGNSSTIVPIQPMWKERSDLIGYFNEFTKKFNETTMLSKLYEAGGRGDLYFTVLDEVNISRIEYYFAEFLSLLEIPDASKRYVDVVADTWASDPKRLKNGKLLLPENMWFIGTANNDDSTFAISDKVYDRAAVLDLDRKCAPFTAEAASVCHISYAELTRLFTEAKETYALSDESREKLAKLDAYMSEVFRVSFGNRILRQIESY
ncbi:MAG: AAA family ATPase, partial [Clostridia bacterium]|nr:AAA family ATPase [Clostridia bacterium]